MLAVSVSPMRSREEAEMTGARLSVRRQAISVLGFTLIELLMVMVVTGILAALGASRFFDNSAFEARDYADQAKAMIRYGQKLAIAQGRQVYVVANGNRIGLCFTSACTAADLVAPPAGENGGSANTKAQCRVGGAYVSSWMCEGRPTAVAMATSRAAEAGAGAATSFFSFDAAGRPYNAADTVGGASTFQTDLTLTFTGGGSYVVTVTAETGYVY